MLSLAKRPTERYVTSWWTTASDRGSLSHRARFRPAQLRLSSDYDTMAGIASGRLSALEALSGGRARLSATSACCRPGSLLSAGSTFSHHLSGLPRHFE